MHTISGRQVFAGLFHAGWMLVLAGLLWPGSVQAQVSPYCPTQTATITSGGSETFDVSACDGPTDFGMDRFPPAIQPSNGSVSLTPATGGVQFATYTHDGDPGATSDTFTLLDPEGAHLTFNITITPSTSAITIAPGSLPALTAGTPVNLTLTATGGTAPYTWSAIGGAVPPGLTFSAGGVLAGTPTQRGTYNFEVRAEDALGESAERAYGGTVQNPSLGLVQAAGVAVQGVAFSHALSTSGGVAPYTYMLETGTFPAGISISPGGVISGTTLAAPGSYPVGIRVTDASTGPGVYFEVESYTLDVAAAPTVTIAVAPASVPEDDAVPLVYTVTRSAALETATAVNLGYDGMASPGDYTGAVASITIPAGATSATLEILPTTDAVVEEDETVVVSLAAGAGYTVGTPASATGTIANDDLPSASISVSPAVVDEDSAADLVYTVALDQPATVPLSLAFSLSGTATAGSDYSAPASPLTIPAGSTTGTIAISPVADATGEPDETVIVTLATGADYAVGTPASATGTIRNDDSPMLSISDAGGVEGSLLAFTVSLGMPAGPGGVTFDIATADGTAVAGADYVAQSLTGQVIPAGATSYSFNVSTLDDAVHEPGETFFVNVTNVTGAVVVDGQGTGTITDNDPAPGLSIDDVSVTEGGSGTIIAAFTVTMDRASATSASVDYATVNGSAEAPADYAAQSGTLTFAPGQTTQTINVPVNGDSTPEADETFQVVLSNPGGATIVDGTGTGTIANDDAPVIVAPPVLPTGTAGVAYSQTVSATGGTAPHTFALAAGALPPGLSLSAGGVLSGTPTAGGSFAFVVAASDSSPAPGPYTGSQSYVLGIAAATVDLPAATLPVGTLGEAYSASLDPASGGTAPYIYAISGGTLPAGMSLSAAGVLGGTPTATGSFAFTVTATDSSTGSGPYTGTRDYSLVVADAAPVASDAALTVAYDAGPTAVPLVLSGGPADSVAVMAGPANGSATASGTTISYQPAPGFAGSDSFTYTASNGSGTSAPATVTITVTHPVPGITASAPLTVALGTAYTQTFSFGGGAAPWSGYAVAGLPAGLAVTATGGDSVTVSGTPSEAGSFALDVSATDSSSGDGPFLASATFNLTVNAPTLGLAPAAGSFVAPYGQPWSQAFSASGGVGPYTYALTGALPAGVTFTGDTLAGTPAQPGSYSITVTATDTGSSGAGAPFTVAHSYTLEVPAPSLAITPAAFPDAVAGTAYSQTLGGSGGVAPYAFAIASGTLPTGLTLAAGTLAGAPTAAGTFSFSLEVSDAHGQTSVQPYTLAVQAPSLGLGPAAATLDAPYAVAFTQVFAATGGVGPYTYALTGTLPAGVAFAGDTLTGTPTQPGSYAITVTATDTGSTGAGAPFTVSRTYTLEVPAPTLAIDPATLANAIAGTAYGQSLVANGGVAPYAFTLAGGALPAGLALAADGSLSGTPTASGSFDLSIGASDTHGQTATRAYTLVVEAPTLSLTPAGGTLPEAVAGTAYSHTLQVGGGIAPYTAVVAGTLPAGLAFDGDTLTLAGTPTGAGSFAFVITVSDSTAGSAGTASASYTLEVAAPTLGLTPDTLPGATAGVAWTQTFVADGGVAPYQYAIASGDLPAGLALDPATGTLAGTPTEAGSFAFAVTATDSTTGTPGTVTVDYTLAVAAPLIVVDPDTLPAAQLAFEYAQALSARGGTAPHAFTLDAGALPAGLVLAADGGLSGTPQEGGTFAITIRATDALGFSGTRSYALEVLARPDPTRDPEVRGLLDAQAAASRRFATSQIANFQQRLQQLHGRGGSVGNRNGLSLATREQCPDNRFYALEHACHRDNRDQARGTMGDAPGLEPGTAGAGPDAAARGFGIWAAGTLRSGNFDGQAGGRGFDFETEGVSAGIDTRLLPQLVLGAGLGYGQDATTVGENGSHLRGRARTIALYGSFQPGEAMFVDGLVGYQRLSFDLQRHLGTTGGFARGTRDGDQLFASLSLGVDLARDAWTFTPYARLDAMRGALEGYTEQGDPAWTLAYGEQDVDTTTGNLGLDLAFRHATGWGRFSPRLRLEYQHDITAEGGASMRYADGIGPVYLTTVEGFDRQRLMLGLGLLFDFGRHSLQLDYRGIVGSGEQRDNAVQLMFQTGH